MSAMIIDWDGKGMPEELRRLPPGRYLVEPVDTAPKLSDEEEDGLRRALESLRAGKGVSLEEARRRIDRLIER